ncbi:MAG TPA: pilus assembly protein TadG-related protein [Bryobacteraceae bacterium]|nr:pilus assembly protein TadG-related protein [Bryobacteraceae bacterium]
MVHRRRGFALAATAVCLPALIAILGLVADAGRVFAVKAELQAFADSAALAAAYELDGTAEGIDRAAIVAATGPGSESARNRWYVSTQAVTGAVSTFARSPDGPWDTSPLSASDVRFVRVAASGNVPLYFLPILPGIATRTTVGAVTVAGQAREPEIGAGLAPFSPDAHTAGDPDFGFTRGQQYTLRWPPPGQRDKPAKTCGGDVGFTPAGGSSDRGYINVGQGNGNSGLVDAIVNNAYYLPDGMHAGSVASMVSGQDHVGGALDIRFRQDTDQFATAYSEYTGNGRRLIIVAVNDHTDAAAVTGFALFFLPPDACGNSNVMPCCAEYVGPGVFAGKRAGAGTAGLYKVRLFR